MRARPIRPAITLIELVAAAALLSVTVAVLGQAAVAQRQAQRRLARDAAAIASLPNLMEEALAAPWTDPPVRPAPEVAAEVARLLPGARVEVVTTPTEGEPHGRRVAVTLSWDSDHKSTRRSRKLVAWAYLARPAGDAP